jgi:hypothetical protein
MAHVEDNAGADAVFKGNLVERIAVALTVNLLSMQDVVRGVHVGAGMERTGVCHGALVKTTQILATGENKVLSGAGEGPQWRVHTPGVTEVINFCHLVFVKIHLGFVKGHVGHNNLLQYK